MLVVTEWPNALKKRMRKRADSAKKKRSVPRDFVANVDPNIDLYDDAMVSICRRMRQDDDINMQKRAGKLVGTKVKLIEFHTCNYFFIILFFKLYLLRKGQIPFVGRKAQ
jgi:hypothetical protein